MAAALALGYEKRTIDEVLDLLENHNVTLVADVRQNAVSRKPGFSKKRLSHALNEAGIGYVHLPDLGCTRTMRAAKRDDVIDRDEYVAVYREHLRTHEDAYDHLVALASDERVAVLCMERRIEDCHRQVLVERLRSDGVDVENVD